MMPVSFSVSVSDYLERRASDYRDIGWIDLAEMLESEAAYVRRIWSGSVGVDGDTPVRCERPVLKSRTVTSELEPGQNRHAAISEIGGRK